MPAILGPQRPLGGRHTADDSLAPPVSTDPSTTPQPAHDQHCAPGLPPAAASPLARSPSSLSLPSRRSGQVRQRERTRRKEASTSCRQRQLRRILNAACLLHRSAACSQPPAVESQMRFDGRAVGSDLPHFARPRVPDPQGWHRVLLLRRAVPPVSPPPQALLRRSPPRSLVDQSPSLSAGAEALHREGTGRCAPTRGLVANSQEQVDCCRRLRGA